MPSEDEIAPHIEELTRALAGNVPEEKVRQELERYLDHGVPLHQAKKDILTALGSGQATTKDISEITATDSSVDVTARIASVNERTVTARGEEKTIWEGEIADETGRIAYTSWVDHELVPDQVLEIKNAYIRTWQGAPQLNIGDNAQVNVLDDDALPPLAELPEAQATTSSPASAPEGGNKQLSELEAGMRSVTVTGRILSVDERTVTARGEEKTIWEGEIADQSGRVMFTSWEDHQLEEGQALTIENAYVRSWQGAPQLNLSENTLVDPTDQEGLPTVDEAPQATPKTTPASTEKEIGELEPGMSAVTVTGRILSVDERTVTARGEEKRLWEGEIADATGKVTYTSWEDHDLETGQVLRVENAYVRSFRGVANLNFGDNSTLERLADDAVPPASELADKEPPTAASGPPGPIKELTPGMNAVTVKGRLLSVRERDVEVKGEPKTLWEGQLADATGKVPYTSWEDHDLTEGQVVEISNAYVRSFRGLASLNFGEHSQVQVLDDDELPPMATLRKNKPYTLSELEQVGGAVGVEVQAVVLEIRPGSGLILRCPECRRVLQDRECQLHGRVEGLADLRIKAVVDDGTGAMIAFFNRQLTEEVLGKDLEACQQRVEEAMTRDIIEHEVAEEILMRRVVIDGNASHDEYGTTLLVESFEIQEPETLADRAEALMERVDTLTREVTA